MLAKRVIVGCVLLMFLMTGCVKYTMVPYSQIEKTNRVEVTQVSGNKIVGTVLKSEPHQLTLLGKDRTQKVIPKSSIQSIKRQPPIMDDLGRGISEEEIAMTKTNRNATIYGIGGGALSFGAGFFVGSMTKGSGATLAATTGVGGALGTYLFIRAGKAKDREVAIETIREKRRVVNLKKETKNKSDDELQDMLEAEKKKQEALRKEREELLRKLNEKKKK